MMDNHKRDCIRTLHRSGLSEEAIAKRLGLMPRTVRNVVSDKITNDPIIRELEAARLDMGLSMTELSARAGYNCWQWQKISRGRNQPSFGCVRDHAEVLGYSIELKREDSK